MSADKRAIVAALVGHDRSAGKSLGSAEGFYLVGSGALPVVLEAAIDQKAGAECSCQNNKGQSTFPIGALAGEVCNQPHTEREQNADTKYSRNVEVDEFYPEPVGR